MENPSDEVDADPPRRASWEIQEMAGGVVKLTVVHDSLEGSPKPAASVAGGWMFIISGLKTVVEIGEPPAHD